MRPSKGAMDAVMSVEAWSIAAKSSSKERWQTFAATPLMLFSAAQNSATVGCWIKAGPGSSGVGGAGSGDIRVDCGGTGGPGEAASGPVGRIELVATEAITAYPHQIKVPCNTAFTSLAHARLRSCRIESLPCALTFTHGPPFTSQTPSILARHLTTCW